MRRPIKQDHHTVSHPMQLESIGNDGPIPALGREIAQHIVQVDPVTGPSDFGEVRVQQLAQPMHVATHGGLVKLLLQYRESSQQYIVDRRAHASHPPAFRP